MTADPEGEVTDLLRRLQEGDPGAGERLAPLVYAELRNLAAAYMRAERADHTLQPTVLVHEAWMKLVNQSAVEWKSRAHFMGIAAQAMRRILVDHARRHRTAKRGGGQKVTLREDEGGADGASVDPVDLVALDRALAKLEELDPRALRVVELRYFAGLEVTEVAEVLDISEATVKRDWRDARIWLRQRLEPATGIDDAESEG